LPPAGLSKPIAKSHIRCYNRDYGMQGLGWSRRGNL
jgi:hypothetical protein